MLLQRLEQTSNTERQILCFKWVERFKLESTSESLLKATSKCDQVAQGLAQASLSNLQGWRFHILSGQPVPVHELTAVLTHSLKNSDFSFLPCISKYVFYNFLALLLGSKGKWYWQNSPWFIQVTKTHKYKTYIRKPGFINFKTLLLQCDLCQSIWLRQESDIMVQRKQLI